MVATGVKVVHKNRLGARQREVDGILDILLARPKLVSLGYNT